MKTTIQPRKSVTLPLGQVVGTSGAAAELDHNHVLSALGRHMRGDWGDVCAEDGAANDAALRRGERIVSVYHSNGVKFYIITEWDRSVTTILLPCEY
jgi:hypothetical protein